MFKSNYGLWTINNYTCFMKTVTYIGEADTYAVWIGTLVTALLVTTNSEGPLIFLLAYRV
jgi:hypothetical protein